MSIVIYRAADGRQPAFIRGRKYSLYILVL
jgi:hypothetical protein